MNHDICVNNSREGPAPIPEFNAAGELPPGEHKATLDEIEVRFGKANARRRILMSGLRRALDNMAAANVRTIWVDGSFITNKTTPNDIDCVWDAQPGVDYTVFDPVFLGTRDEMKVKYGLEFFPNVIEGGSGKPFPVYFQTNRLLEPKGIVVVKYGA